MSKAKRVTNIEFIIRYLIQRPGSRAVDVRRALCAANNKKYVSGYYGWYFATRPAWLGKILDVQRELQRRHYERVQPSRLAGVDYGYWEKLEVDGVKGWYVTEAGQAWLSKHGA